MPLCGGGGQGVNVAFVFLLVCVFVIFLGLFGLFFCFVSGQECCSGVFATAGCGGTTAGVWIYCDEYIRYDDLVCLVKIMCLVLPRELKTDFTLRMLCLS